MAVVSLTARRREPIRRGVALLLILAMIVLIVPVAVGFSQRALLASAEKRISERGQIADSVRVRLEAGPLQKWLSSESAKVVLPVEAESSRVDVLHEHWLYEDCTYEVLMTAWDQCGMAPLSSITAGSPLRAAIPGEISRRIEAIDAPKTESVGLDQFALDPFVLEPSAFRSAFPSPDEYDKLSLGAWIATHPVGQNASINANTAPVPLVEAALAVAGRSGIEAIIAARTEGRLAPLPSGLDRDAPGGPSNAPRLVGSSSSWSVRIDVRVGSVRRSWWTVYRLASGKWECVQRLVIPD